MNECLLWEQDGGAVMLTLNRPEMRNAISAPDMIAAVEDAVRRVNADTAIRAVVMTGTGSAFSSGGDVKEMASPEMLAQSAEQIRQGYMDGIQRIPRALQTLRVPLVAAVNGHAVGAGLDLACMADLRIASSRAKFASSFVKLGIVPGDGGVAFLRRAVGSARAAEMIFTGEAIDAARALEWGLVSQVVEPEALREAAWTMARRIAVNPGPTLRLVKRLFVETDGMRIDGVLELSACVQAIAYGTAEHKEAVTAFAEKRPPVFG